MKCKFSVCPLETDCNIVLVSGQRVQTGDAHQDAQVLETEGGQGLPDAHLGTVVSYNTEIRSSLPCWHPPHSD